jgi:DNA polymerase elongation subunit (family B)
VEELEFGTRETVHLFSIFYMMNDRSVLRYAVMSEPELTLFLREVTYTYTDSWAVWLFGNTVRGNSVAVKVTDFQFALFIEKPDMDTDTFGACLEEEVGENCIQRIQEGSRLPVIGYSYTREQAVLEVTLAQYWGKKKIVDYLASEPFRVKSELRRLRVYHATWEPEALFLHRSGLQLCSWIRVSSHQRVSASKRVTTCQIESSSLLSRVHPAASGAFPTDPLLICSVFFTVHPLVDDAGNRLPDNPDHPGNRITCLHAEYRWFGGGEPTTAVYEGSAENVLLAGFFRDLERHDPDVLVCLTEKFNPLIYLVKRSVAAGVAPQLSRFKLRTARYDLRYQLYETEHFVSLKHLGRSRFDLRDAVMKMQLQPPLGGYHVSHLLHHGRLLKDPDLARRAIAYLDKRVPGADNRGYLALLAQIARSLEVDNNLLLNCMQLSKACFTGLNTVNEGGQQVRVWNKLAQTILQKGLVFNDLDLERAPYVVRKARADSSYPDPPACPNTPLGAAQAPSRAQLNLFQRPVEQDPKKAAVRSQGGCVFEPEKGIHTDLTLLFDFASLYPSIMQAYGVCPMRLVLEGPEAAAVLADPAVRVSYVPISDEDCIVMVDSVAGQPVPTMLDEATFEVCEERKRIRQRMKGLEKGSFEYLSLDAAQLACKVFQNSLYGTLGVRMQDRRSRFSVPVLMKMVCTIGQRMINTVRHWLQTKYGGYLVYGDTDSVLVQFRAPPGVEGAQALFDWGWAFGRELEQEAVPLFKEPNRLELEKVFSRLILYRKKMYAGIEHTSSDFSVPPVVNIKGLPSQKRDRCPWVRTTGKTVVHLLLEGDTDGILRLLEAECGRVLRGDLPLTQLEITCCLKNLDEYKNENLIQKVTADRLHHRDGYTVEAGSRLAYVIVEGKGPLYERGETLEFIRANRLRPDWGYYFLKQLLPPMEFQLQFLPELCLRVKRLLNSTLRRLQLSINGVKSLVSYGRKRKLEEAGGTQ